jgi:hypothetical protein
LNVNFGYESVPTSIQASSFSVATATGVQTANALASDKTAAWILGASYNLGVATVNAAFEGATADFNGGQAKDSGYTFGVAFPINKQTTLAASYAYEKTTADGVSNDGSSKGFGAQVIYNWTAQAAIYAGVVQTKTVVLADTAEVTATKYAAGIRYNF